MRDIKYRVWDVVNKEYSYPGSKEFLLSMSGYLYDGLGCIYDEEHIVQQYTGLKDKNGKEIYEGDICDAGIVIGPIEYIIGSFSLASNPLIEYLPKDISVFSSDFDPSWIDVKVIGNIHETPELLK